MEEKVQKMFRETELTLEQIARTLGVSYKVVWGIVATSFSKAERLERKRRNYARSKQGSKNPMFGKQKEEHPRFIGRVADGNGYFMVLKPEWYTGRAGSKHVFEHSVVFCEAAGLTEVPKGFCVHHLDHDKANNAITNLALLSVGAHSRLHSLEGATTIRKE